MMRKPTCFIAMAFSKDDTDQLYDEQIKPVLDKLGIKAIIINRVESNDDLNIQIIEQLEKCDFCIADLTYTRPSVYFEAGYAQRATEVIYTVRADHLGKNQADDRRVHFDLQMKPLIRWSSPSDRKFSIKLDKRIKNTFLPIWYQKEKVEREENVAIQEFNSKPSELRVFILQNSAIRFMQSFGFETWHSTDKRFSYTQEDIQSGRIKKVFSYQINKSVLHLTSVQSYPTALKKDLVEHSLVYSPLSFIYRLGLEIPKKIRVCKTNHIVLSLRSVPESRIEGVFPHLTPLKSPNNYYYERRLLDQPYFRKDAKYKSSWNFISGIKSKPDLDKKLTSLSDYLLT
jgi:hypothetical protein